MSVKSLLDFTQTHLRVLALALPWITSETADLINSDGDKKSFTTHFSMFTINGIAEINEWSYGHQSNFDSRYPEVASIIALLVISLLISVFVYIMGKAKLGDITYTAFHFMQWVFDLIVIGLFYGLVEEELERLNYDAISFGLFALIGCLLVSTFHVARLAGQKTKLWTFGDGGSKY